MAEQLIWHGSPFSPPDEGKIAQTLPEALADAAARWSDRTALLHGDQHYSFADLARRASRLAEQLIEADIGVGPVALLQSVGPDAVAAWFACAMCGRAFLLLDPTHPPLRLQELIKNAKACAIVCDAPEALRLADALALPALVPDGRLSSMQLSSGLGVDEPAMIFPTSGSTGQPKLVTYSARTLQAKVQASIALMRIPSSARVVIAGSHGNYGFVHHSLVFILSGGSICLADIKAGGFRAVIDAIVKLGARHARFTPSIFRAFASLPEAHDALRSLDAVRFSGEALLASDLKLARAVLPPGCLIQNIYGSTESALFVWTSDAPLDSGTATVPIGYIYPGSSYALRPIDNSTELHTGELVIRSARHALGDLIGEEVCADRFNPVPLKTGIRDYATGDMARRLTDGSLMLLGRIDRLVKVRGQRVFLAEVENHLIALPGVIGAAVIDAGEPGDTELHGFVTLSENTVHLDNARGQLAERLPDYMVPRSISVVAQIPLLPGGKVDVAALRACVPGTKEGVAAATNDRKSCSLYDIWSSILGTGADNPANDFFTLGGDSLKLMELVMSIERQFACKLSVEKFLADPTLTGLGRLVGAPLPPDIGAANCCPKKEGAVRLRHVWPGKKPSQGIALGMPGWRGSAPVFPFIQAGLFLNHELWAAEIALHRDSILAEGQWWHSAMDIASQLRQGAMPCPRILFGYSAGGSIAWLVGRLLAGTPQCPEYVVMVDAAPLHNLASYSSPELIKAINSAGGDLPKAVHIHRASLAHVGINLGYGASWKTEDNVQLAISIPTVDHDDMLLSEMLVSAASNIHRFLEGQQQEHQPTCLNLERPKTLGVRAYEMLSSGDARGRPELEALVSEMQRTSGWDLSPGLLYLVLRDGSKDQANAILETIINRQPESRLLRYAKYRLKRHAHALRPTRKRLSLTQGFLGLEEIESALATHRPVNRGYFKELLARFLQACDMFRAEKDAYPHRSSPAYGRRVWFWFKKIMIDMRG